MPNVAAIIFGVFLIAATVLTLKCYPVYNLTDGFDSEVRLMLWTFMSLPSVIMPITLLLTNLLGKKYSAGFIILSFICCLYFVAVRIILSYKNDTEILYLLCLCSFYLIYLTLALGIKESFEVHIKNKIIGIILPSFFALILGATLGFTVNYELGIPFFTRTILIFALPILMLSLLLCVIALKFTARLKSFTLAATAVLLPIGIFIACFECANTRIFALVYSALLVALFVKICFDIFARNAEKVT